MSTDRICRTCGSIYTDSAGGRHTHKVLFGHAPSPEREAPSVWDEARALAEKKPTREDR